MFKYIKNKLKEKIFNYEVSEEDDNTIFEKTNTKLWLYANYTVIFFIILSIIIIFFDSIPGNKEKYLIEIFILDFIISSVFLFEYIYRYRQADEKTKFLFSTLNILDLLSFLPFFILLVFYWIWSYPIFAIFRIFRIFRIFELIERVPVVTKLFSWIYRHKLEYLSWFFIISVVLVVSSVLVYFSEQYFWNKEIFSSMPATLWWSIVTLSTTWYGDMIPQSIVWKIIAWILMILWPMFVAILSSITAIIFLETTKIINFNKDK